METEQQRRDFLNAEFASDPRSFLRRFVKALKTTPDRCRPANTTLQDMIDFIIEAEKQQPDDSRESTKAAIERFNESSFLIVRPTVRGC